MPDSVGAGGFPRNINIGHEHLDLSSGFTYQYQGGVPTDVLNWKIIGGVTNVDPSTIGWGAKQLGAIWFNIPEKAYKVFDGTLVSPLISLNGLLTMNRSAVIVEDDFISGTVTSQTIGALGWLFTTGTTSELAAESNHPGILRRTTGATPSAVASTTFGPGSASSIFLSDANFDVTWIFRLPNLAANEAFNVGLGLSSQAELICFAKDAADVNLFTKCRTGGTTDKIDTGVVLTGDWINGRIIKTAGTVLFYVNNELKVTTTTRVPAAAGITAIAQLTNGADSVDKSLDLDYFQMMISGLQR